MSVYRVDYERGAGKTPWVVYRLTRLTPNGAVWLASFETKALADAFVAERMRGKENSP